MGKRDSKMVRASQSAAANSAAQMAKRQTAMDVAAAVTMAAMDVPSGKMTKPAPTMTLEEMKAKWVPSRLKIGLSDMAGGGVAQGLNEGWNLLMRLAGKWSVDGFWAKQNDYMQSSVPAIGGLAWYLIELYGLGKAPLTGFKMGRLEAAKILSHLGMSKFFQALRGRTAEQKELLEYAQAEGRRTAADNASQKATIDKLKLALEEAAKRTGDSEDGARRKPPQGGDK